MTDELSKQGRLSRPKSSGRNRTYLFVILSNIIMFRKWLFHFYPCRWRANGGKMPKAIKFRFDSNWLPECFIKFGIVLRDGRKLSVRNKSNNEDEKSISSLLTIRCEWMMISALLIFCSVQECSATHILMMSWIWLMDSSTFAVEKWSARLSSDWRVLFQQRIIDFSTDLQVHLVAMIF